MITKSRLILFLVSCVVIFTAFTIGTHFNINFDSFGIVGSTSVAPPRVQRTENGSNNRIVTNNATTNHIKPSDPLWATLEPVVPSALAKEFFELETLGIQDGNCQLLMRAYREISTVRPKVETPVCRGSSCLENMTTYFSTVHWANFSPRVQDVAVETDFATWVKEHPREWSNFSGTSMQDPSFNEQKRVMNRMGFVLNKHIVPEVDHVPIWIRVFRRVDPLKRVLQALCENDDIEKTQLIVTVDGDDFDKIVTVVREVVQCTRVRLFWHTVDDTLKHLDLTMKTRTIVINAHFIYGLYLAFAVMNTPYVITLEDDLMPSPDFYRNHASLYRYTLDKGDAFAVASFTQGPIFNCQLLPHRQQNPLTNNCTANTLDTIVKDKWFPGWGSGIPWMRFIELHSVIREKSLENAVYDGVLVGLLKHHNSYAFIPCSVRAQYLPNVGVHGEGGVFWSNYEQMQRWPNTPPYKRLYRVLN